MGDANIVILGAGVIGLTTGLLLSNNPKYKVTIVAKHMPGDYDIEYASPWAGANYFPVAKEGTDSEKFERETWPALARLATDLPEAGVHFQEAVIYNRSKDADTATGEWFAQLLKQDPWFKNVVPNFKVLSKRELPSGIDSGTSFTSVCINTSIYLPWLVSQCLKNGVTVKRGIVSHVTEAAGHHISGHSADMVINCTGLSAAKLGGVEDQTVQPARGQIVVVRNDPGGVMASISGTDDGSDEATYIMHRPAGGGCILGGCYQKGSWESQPDPNLAIRIMKRCAELCPTLTGGKGIEALSIVRHGVGLRPLREDGPRVEMEKIDNVSVVHNYGHGGYGYQTSYGCATRVKELVDAALRTRPRL